MFDWYDPVPPILCPKCGANASGWQGKDGENGLFLWRQGVRHPVDQLTDEELQIPPSERRGCELPASFDIWTWCDNGHWLDAKGHAPEGLWSTTDGVRVGRTLDLAESAT